MLTGGAIAAGDDFGALLQRVGNVRLDLLDRLHVDQWPDHRARLEPVRDLHRPGGLGEALGKGVVDAVPHQDAVGADIGLAGVALFRDDRALTVSSISALSNSNLPTSVEPLKI